MEISDLHIPTESEFEAAVREAFENDSNDVTPERVLGVTPEVVQAIVGESATSEQNHEAVAHVLSALPGSSYAVSSDHRVIISGRRTSLIHERLSARRNTTTYQKLAKELDDFAESAGINSIVFIQRSNSTHRPILDGSGVLQLPTYTLRVFLPSVSELNRNVDTSSIRNFGARSVNMTDVVESDEHTISAGDVPLGKWLDENSIELFYNPFIDDEGKLSGTRLEARVRQAASALDHAGSGTNVNMQSRDVKRLRDMIETVQMIPELRQISQIDINALIDSARAEFESVAQEAAELRSQLTDKLRVVAEQQQKLDRLIQNDGSDYAADAVIPMMVQISRIKRLTAVRDVRMFINRRNNKPSLRVVLHPYVMEFRSRRVLLDKLAFTLHINDGSNGGVNITWDEAGFNSSPHSPHPHVSTSKNTCWGQAEQALKAAASRQDYVTLITLIAGWAAMYNSNSPHVAITSFASRGEFSPGWHPELPSGASA